MSDTPERDDRYLWDRSAPVDPAVAEIENSLRPLAFDPRAQPLQMPARRLSLRRVFIPIGLAAGLLIAAGVGFLNWRLSWPAGRAWSMTKTADASAAIPSTALPVGGRLQTSPSEQAVLQIARLGAMTVAPDSDVTLGASGPLRHRVDLSRGTVDVRVWAPPGRLVVRTPVGDIIDLGCIFRLNVDADGATTLQVRTGWVQMNDAYGESLIPAGASSRMTADQAPLVPLYDDAVPAFQTGLRALEQAVRTSSGNDRANEATVVGQQARAKDVLTLLMLATRSRGAERAALVQAAARLAPPPVSVSVDDVASGNDTALWAWRDSLPLPPVKSWWRNWLDVLPR